MEPFSDFEGELVVWKTFPAKALRGNMRQYPEGSGRSWKRPEWEKLGPKKARENSGWIRIV